MRMELDQSKALLAGLCAGFARWGDVDLMLTRVTMVLIAFFFAPIAIPAYIVAAVLLQPRSDRRPGAATMSRLDIRIATVRGVYGF